VHLPSAANHAQVSLRERRSAGRVRMSADIQCNLGIVVDLSATGMRVYSRSSHSGILKAVVIAPNIGVEITAQVVWRRRHGFRKHSLGLRFLDVDPNIAAVLTRIASEHRLRRVA
jgi:c-di-GMP-binding flagellar brake protein YcgR